MEDGAGAAIGSVGGAELVVPEVDGRHQDCVVPDDVDALKGSRVEDLARGETDARKEEGIEVCAVDFPTFDDHIGQGARSAVVADKAYISHDCVGESGGVGDGVVVVVVVVVLREREKHLV